MRTIHEVLKEHPGLLHVTIGQIGALILGATLWFTLAELLVPDAYGQVNWFMSIAMFASTICVLGWGTTIVAYYPKERRDELLGGATAIVLVASLAVGITIGLVVYPLVSLLIIGFSLFSITLSSELGKRRYRRYKWIQIGTKLVALPLAIGLYFLIGLLGILLGYAIPLLVLGLPSLRYVRRGNPGIIEVRGKVGFAARAFGANTAGSSTRLLDKILIGSFFGMATLGLYQLAYQIFMILSVLPMVLFSYLLPEKSAGAKTKQVENLSVLISIALAALVVVFSPVIIPRIFPGFSESVSLIQIMSLGVIPSTIAAAKMSELYARERPGAVLISYLPALVAGIVGIMVLGKLFGGAGLATGMLILQVTLAVSLTLFKRVR